MSGGSASALLGFDPAGATPASGAWPGGGSALSGDVAFPFRVDPHGRVATADWPQHLEQMIEQVLFTAPGERVNRPDFGCGVMELVFADESDALVTATQFLVQGSLQRWLGDVISVGAVRVAAQGSELAVTVQYTLRASGAAAVATFRRRGGAP